METVVTMTMPVTIVNDGSDPSKAHKPVKVQSR